jgi:hypothetical protein
MALGDRRRVAAVGDTSLACVYRVPALSYTHGPQLSQSQQTLLDSIGSRPPESSSVVRKQTTRALAAPALGGKALMPVRFVLARTQRGGRHDTNEESS